MRNSQEEGLKLGSPIKENIRKGVDRPKSMGTNYLFQISEEENSPGMKESQIAIDN